MYKLIKIGYSLQYIMQYIIIYIDVIVVQNKLNTKLSYIYINNAYAY